MYNVPTFQYRFILILQECLPLSLQECLPLNLQECLLHTRNQLVIYIL